MPCGEGTDRWSFDKSQMRHTGEQPTPRARVTQLLPGLPLVHITTDLKDNNCGHILKGVDTLANAVSVTLGPKGRNVIIEQSFGGPKITKDGVTVAKLISLENKFENLGARTSRQKLMKLRSAGDGTMTATVLACAIYSEGVKNVAAGCNPMDLRRGSQAAVECLVATVSANGDAHVGNLIAQAMEKVGKEGVITVKEGRTIEEEIEITEGMSTARHSLRFGDNRKSILDDLAILAGGTVFTYELDIKLEQATPELLGSTGSVTITKDDTIILNGEGSKDAIQKKDRYDDALNATRAAVEEGILPGGGVALLKASLALATNAPGPSSQPTSRTPSQSRRPTLIKIWDPDKFAWGYDVSKGHEACVVEAEEKDRYSEGQGGMNGKGTGMGNKENTVLPMLAIPLHRLSPSRSNLRLSPNTRPRSSRLPSST
ncbi:GroEL equatorial domain-like protein [Gloeophyllum trabeum ATCC 11539]|uniref:GroEL equatorial domain-like protein n=1 Tax=Gloeophyllum trabeum (strain ATCC 11539 / FP-39264 / Madison 617) TaxID=670483 RepID=S7QC41_GLOTA|nr:GroEL equatorial domain-like protein [Gloeophyllum trabeum ATCC 11539]EPQ56928.1 GroEL equatorial domain-like protein [Gloeophyllum trabeum ATCC 11539]